MPLDKNSVVCLRRVYGLFVFFAGGIDISKAKEVMRAEDKFDRQAEKERVRQRKLEEKRKRKEAEQRRRKVSPRRKRERGGLN